MYSKKIVVIILAYMLSVLGAFAVGYKTHSHIAPMVVGLAALIYLIYTVICYIRDKNAGRSLYGYVKVIGYQTAVVVMFALMTYSFSLG